MKNTSYINGFTLLEMLIGMLMTTLVMGAIVGYFQSSTRASYISVSRAEMQQDVVNAQQIIAGRLREAWYIYPSGTTISLGSGTAKTRMNPITGNNTWNIDGPTIPKDPIVAMILPPQVPGDICNSGGVTSGCYRFYAYYAEKRSDWLTGNAPSSAENPGDDPLNTDVWVLVQYNINLFGFTPTMTIPSSIAGGNASLLADYIAPSNVPAGMPSTPYTMFTIISPTLPTAPAGAAGVTINLATFRRIGSGSTSLSSTVLRYPDATSTYSLTSFPTNLGKIVQN
ncbi:prepilin-type cleavage/methylation domain-containing protein [Deinococcus sp.]|uniref:PilW family protein n=1 Tax=Deinococcus sp. TaxID=47478 RepID=UPI0025C516AC|nr:prepilin-type cleavage/methylation domain-containing protein [Deinococcus sp.]